MEVSDEVFIRAAASGKKLFLTFPPTATLEISSEMFWSFWGGFDGHIEYWLYGPLPVHPRYSFAFRGTWTKACFDCHGVFRGLFEITHGNDGLSSVIDFLSKNNETNRLSNATSQLPDFINFALKMRKVMFWSPCIYLFVCVRVCVLFA